MMQAAPKGQVPPDLKIISVKKFTHEQHNAACGSCHAKVSPLTTVFPPGERFFDHFDLVTLENPDYYPDGRDLGENYTYTTWLLSPCVKAGKLDCIKCHTSSGRYRFKDEAKANDACLPCHAERVGKAAEHIHHPPDKPGVPTKCVSCHMPMTAFARMNRSDHSMLPPAPAATMKFGSPNACNLCHKDKDAAWADQERAANGGPGTTRRRSSSEPASSTRPGSATGKNSRRCWPISRAQSGTKSSLPPSSA